MESFHCGSVTNPVRKMEEEHASFEEMLSKLRSLTDQYTLPEGSCRTYASFYEKLRWLESDTLEHATLENTELHPLARKRELQCLIAKK